MNFYSNVTIIDRYLLITTVCQICFAAVAITANFYLAANLIFRKKLRTQTYVLLFNISLAEFAIGVLYLCYCTLQFYFTFDRAPYVYCIKILAPFLWISLVLSCLSLVAVRSRTIQVIAYGDSTSGGITTERWKMTAALVTLWIVSLAGTVWSFYDEGELTALAQDSCLFPFVINRGVLVPYFLFATSVIILLLFEYARFFFQIIFGTELKLAQKNEEEDDDKFSVSISNFNTNTIDRKLIRNIAFVAGIYFGCWVPIIFLVFYCLNNYNQINADKLTKSLVHFVWTLPVLHSAISPFIYISLDFDLCHLRPKIENDETVIPIKRQRSKSVNDGIMLSAVTLAMPSIFVASQQPSTSTAFTNYAYASEYM